MDKLHEKYSLLLNRLREMGCAAVAFSGGVDSTFLLAAAKEALSGNVIAVTAQPCFFPEREMKASAEICRRLGVRQFVIPSHELSIDGFRHNPENRCYLCKKQILTAIRRVAEENGIDHIIEGSNTDDAGDYRPGSIAVAELGVESPLKAAGLSKSGIRQLSREMGLPTWDKPSLACLASRIPYGEEITAEKLSMVDRAEQLLLDLGFSQIRVRLHGKAARIELLPEEFNKLIENREKVCSQLKELGFTYISLDLQGYRTGSLNETLGQK